MPTGAEDTDGRPIDSERGSSRDGIGFRVGCNIVEKKAVKDGNGWCRM